MTALLNPPESAVAGPSRLAGFGPNWFASVMGTGIVANAAALLPVHIAGLATAALVVWMLAAALLVGLLAVSVAHALCHPAVAAGHHRDLAMAPFYGAPAMALLTVGSGALLAGRPLIGAHAAVILDAVLWSLGTAGGLVCAVAIPYLMFTLHRPRLDEVYGNWLLAVVPPVVAATAGAGLIGHLPAGQARLSMEIVCLACVGVSMAMAAVLIVLLWARLALHGVGPARMVPSLWIVLGSLGQSITATSLLAHAGHSRLAADAALAYGIPVWGFAIAWLALAAAVTLATARRHLPFSLGWWAFTFPVGTVVTGTSELALRTHAELFTVAAVVLYGLLVVNWATVAVRTAAATISGRL